MDDDMKDDEKPVRDEHDPVSYVTDRSTATPGGEMLSMDELLRLPRIGQLTAFTIAALKGETSDVQVAVALNFLRTVLTGHLCATQMELPTQFDHQRLYSIKAVHQYVLFELHQLTPELAQQIAERTEMATARTPKPPESSVM